MIVEFFEFFVKNMAFNWMEIISTSGKTNFFERRVGEYQIPQQKKNDNHDFETTCDF